MKKVLSLVLVAVVVASLFALAACGNKAEPTLKLGLGVVATYGEPKNADGDTNGSAKVTNDAVAVLLDAEGKIVDIAIDTLDATAAWTSKGKAAAATELKTKYELGTDYNMAAYGKKHDGSDGAVLEWYAQAAAFDAALEGKSADEFAAFAGEDGYSVGDLATAGCTINIADMVKAATAAATVA